MLGWFSQKSRQQRQARKRINDYFDEVARAIREGRAMLSLTKIAHRNETQPGTIMPSHRTVRDVDFEVRYQEKEMTGSLRSFTSDTVDGMYDEGTYVMVGDDSLGIEYRGVFHLMDVVDERVKPYLKAVRRGEKRLQDDAEARVAETLSK